VVYGAPLVVYEFAFAVLGSADRVLVRHYLGADALGLYSVAYGLAYKVNELLVTPLGLALIPMYMRIWAADGPEKTSAFLSVSFDLFILACIGVMPIVAAASNSLVILLASEKYAGIDTLIPVFLAGLLFWAANVFVAAGLLIHKRTLQMAALLVIAAVINIGLNCLLLPRMGLMGGAIATSVSFMTCIVSLAWASNRYLSLHVDLRACARYTVAAAIAWVGGVQVGSDIAAVDVLVKSTVVFAIYVAVLYALDGRVRNATSWGYRWLRAQATFSA